MAETIINPDSKKTFPFRLVIIFVLFSAAIILVGILYYDSLKNRIFKEEEDNLAAIASLKINQIERWHNERLGDATVIASDKPLIRSFASLLNSDNRDAKTDIYDWMKSVIKKYDYKNVLIADTSFKVRLSVIASDTVLGDSIRKVLKTNLKSHVPFISDLQVSKEIPYIHLDILIPIFDSVCKKQVPLGVAVLRIDPDKILFPLIQSWPTQSKSSETLLLRKEGDSVLYLNELRHAKNTALKLKLPLSSKNLLATKAVNGFEGLTEGIDYRNVPVIGSIQKIHETPWYMVAKVDKEEILLPLQKYSTMIVMVVVLLILINASIFGFWIWQQRIKFYRSQLKNEVSLRESEMRFRQTFDLSPIGIVMVGLDRKFLRCNDSFSKSLGFKMKELEGKTIAEVTHPEDISIGMEEMIAIAKGELETSHVQKRYLRKDGEIVWGDVLISLIRNNLGEPQYFLAIIQDITESKKIIEALRESEERFRSLYENATVGIYRTTLDGKILMANPTLVKMLGFSSFEELSQRNLEVEGYEPDYPRAKFRETLEKEGKIIGLESAWHQRNGNTLYVRESASVIRDEEGKILYYDGNVEDITYRKLAEEALRESEDKFKYVFDHSVTGKSITLPTGEIHVNKAFCDMLGYRQEELEKTKWQDISHPDDIEMTQNIIESILSGEKDSTRFIKRYIHKNGRIVWTDVGSALRRDEKGIPLYFLTAIIDISERKHTEESLRLKNFVFDDSIAANSISDMEGNLTEVNAAFVKIWGYQSKDEVIGKSLADFIKETSDANKIIAALNSKGEWEGDYSAIRKDGSTFIAHGLATVVKDENGKGIGYQSAVLDVTDAKMAEEFIHRLYEDLEQKVKQRTELLEAANKELEAFSYSVSHDLRAPLRSVHGFTKILLEDYEAYLDEEGKRICRIISSSATQMGELIDDLLSFSRIGRTSINPSLLDMRSIVRSVFEEISTPDEKSKTTLKIGKLHKTYGDANLLKLVWTNLISNAIKYSSKESISEISVNSQLKYDRITYSVKDNGVGFDMKYKHKLFGVFQRLHSESEFEGNGVGLAIVQRIIIKHGGKVWAEGEEGKGATFYFSLPVQDKRQK